MLTPDFSDSKIVTSHQMAELYDVPHEEAVKHLDMILGVINKMNDEEPNEKYTDHGIFPTVRDGERYYELSEMGFTHFKSHAIEGRVEKWQDMYLLFWQEKHRAEQTA